MKVNKEDLRFWPILNYLPTTALDKIRLVYVFGHGGSDAILATNDDEIVLFGFNRFYCHGDECCGTSYETKPFQKLEELSKKRVKELKRIMNAIITLSPKCLNGFASNMHSEETAFVLAYLECGEVYIWGRDPAAGRIFANPSLIDELPKTVTEVACGIGHILALTSNGEVFGWGENSCRQVTHLNQGVIPVPVQIQEALKPTRVIQISCGFHFSVALTEGGFVYGWGQNNKGQLGLNMVSKCEGIPCRTVFQRYTCIKSIACGSNHVLALDNRGDIFSWGSNEFQQLGCFEVQQQRSLPSRLDEDFRFTEIAASVNLSVALSTLGSVYVYGQTFGDLGIDCFLTPCRTINEAFAMYNCGRMYKAIEIASENETISETIGKSFGNQEDCDFKFIAEGKEIYVHKTVLKLRSQYFKRMFQENWLEAKKSSVQIDEKYEALVAFLKYLYTDKLEVDPRVALEVSVIADKYCETGLVNVCLQKFRQGLNDDNLAELYELAFENKMTNFSELCIDFASYHLYEVITSKGFRDWKADTHGSFFGQDKIKKACRNW